MATNTPQTYRLVLRELKKAVSPRKVNQVVVGNFRALLEKSRIDPTALRDARDATLFLKSQREHKALLERYNPLFDLTSQERIEATARRVGLNMPKRREGDA
ncbi:hypothetical protein AX16_010305 [Volvariella volvacea WC 439]|nr:hypothetical protein AX16_010305 [Volvariella volvacea WC 439]